jgi:CRISPR-associated protein Cmr3
MLGKEAGSDFNAETVESLKQISIAGPMPLIDDQLYWPRPLDCVVRQQDGRRTALAVRPEAPPDGEGCNLPPGLWPSVLDFQREDFKPVAAPAFWSTSRLKEWLLGRGFDLPGDSPGMDWGNGFLKAPEQDERIHAQMDCGRGAACDEGLFASTGLDLTQPKSGAPWRMGVKVTADQSWRPCLERLDSLHPFGGERRLVRWQHWDESQAAAMWNCPAEIRRALSKTAMVRMALATPAIFAKGWKPGWLDGGPHDLEGSLPGSALRLRLVGAAIGRWRPISGWSLEANRVGPKPVRRAAPAGSVYFFQIVEGTASDLSRLWLQSVCDCEQDRRDGFGLALWGVWEQTPPRNSGA